jgi:hypothetical protein
MDEKSPDAKPGLQELVGQSVILSRHTILAQNP